MKSITKYTILVLFAALASIGIYEYINNNKPIKVESNVLTYQDTLEKEFLSSTDYTLDNPKVILNPYKNAPLSALIIFETKDLTTPKITIKGKDGADDLVHTFIPNKVHILPIYGLYANYNNEVIINASGGSKTINIKTDKLPNDFIETTNITGELKTNNFYFTTPEDKKYTAAYDNNGEVRWYLIGDYKWQLQRLNNGHLLISNDKLINQPYYSKGLMEIDLLGKIYYQYNIIGGYHHSTVELENGNFLTASNNFKDGTVEDYIIEIDRSSGKIVKEWNLHKLQKNNKENWLGLNSMIYNNKTNSITFAGNNGNIIANIDYKSGEINWIISNKENIPKKYHKYILNSNVLPNNPKSLNISDDGSLSYINTKNDGIYLTTFKIDLDNKKAKTINETLLDTNKVDASIKLIDQNNYILTGDNYFKEKSNDQEIKFTTNGNLYNTEKMSLYANDIYTNGAGVKLGTLGITPTIKDISILFHKTDNKVIDKYNLKFVKEADRLVVTGTFNSNDKIELILDNFLTKRTYDLIVSETPYKKQKQEDKKITVSKYINNDDVYGKFYIFIRINGVNYKLNKYVTF